MAIHAKYFPDQYGGVTVLDEPMPGTQREYWLSCRYGDWDKLNGVEIHTLYPAGEDADGPYEARVQIEKLIAQTPEHWKGDGVHHVSVIFEEHNRTRFVVHGAFPA